MKIRSKMLSLKKGDIMAIVQLFISLSLFSGSLLFAMEVPALKGDIFTALPIPENIKLVLGGIQTELAQCFRGMEFSASALDNLHITIQVIASYDAAHKYSLESYIERIKNGLTQVPGSFKQFAQSKGWDKPWDFANKLQSGTVVISQNGVVMLYVGSSELLKRLGAVIEQELSKVGIQTKRNDVTEKYEAHITLGQIAKDKVTEAKSKKCGIDFKTKFKDRKFVIDQFVLLQSNRPEKVRKYYQHGGYELRLGL